MFVTYENRANPHVTIHRDGCGQIRKRGGVHKYGQGEYKNHGTLSLAIAYANTTGLPVIDCLFVLQAVVAARVIIMMRWCSGPNRLGCVQHQRDGRRSSRRVGPARCFHHVQDRRSAVGCRDGWSLVELQAARQSQR